MKSGRMEAFSDGVLAIIITIMVLELHAPGTRDLTAVTALVPSLLSYVMSFVYLGIYWNNHHHLLQAAENVDGRVLWANMHLLFWLSLVPLVTAWMGQSSFAAEPVALYGVVMLMAAIAYYLLTLALVALHGRDSVLARALGRDLKGKASIAMYLAAVAVTALGAPPVAGCALYAAVAALWLVPDRRIEKSLAR